MFVSLSIHRSVLLYASLHLSMQDVMKWEKKVRNSNERNRGMETIAMLYPVQRTIKTIMVQLIRLCEGGGIRERIMVTHDNILPEQGRSPYNNLSI